MSKQGTIFFVLAILSMILPYILGFIGLGNDNSFSFYPKVALVLSSAGFFLHVINGIKNKNLNLSGFILLLSIFFIITGFSLWALKVMHSRYILLFGMLLVGFWLIIPFPKNTKD